MPSTLKLNVQIAEDHTIRLPDDVPAGPALVIVLTEPTDADRRRAELAERRRGALGAAAGLFTVPEDFDAPLPAEILQHFTGVLLEPEGA